MKTKSCIKCKVEKPTGEFYFTGQTRDCRDGMCKECRREKNRIQKQRRKARELANSPYLKQGSDDKPITVGNYRI